MAKAKSIALYDRDHNLLEVHANNASVKRSTADWAHSRVFYEVYPEQVKYLGYAQAVDLETILQFAKATNNKN